MILRLTGMIIFRGGFRRIDRWRQVLSAFPSYRDDSEQELDGAEVCDSAAFVGWMFLLI